MREMESWAEISNPKHGRALACISLALINWHFPLLLFEPVPSIWLDSCSLKNTQKHLLALALADNIYQTVYQLLSVNPAQFSPSQFPYLCPRLHPTIPTKWTSFQVPLTLKFMRNPSIRLLPQQHNQPQLRLGAQFFLFETSVIKSRVNRTTSCWSMMSLWISKLANCWQ